MRYNGTTVPTTRDNTYDTSEVHRYDSSGGGGDIDVEALDVTENGIYTAPDGKAYSPVNVNVAGGGSSDFSTATVTVVNNEGPCSAEIYNIVSMEGSEGLVATAGIVGFTTTIISAVLYKDYCEFYIDGFDASMQTTGNASYEGDGFAIITGDCTITISGGPK